MSSYPLLKQFADERARLVAAAAARVHGVRIERRPPLSGFVWRDDLVVTAAEGLGGAERVLLVSGESERPATVLAADRATDVAVLRSDGPLAAADAGPLAAPSPTNARTGEPVVAVGRRGAQLAAHWSCLELVGPAWRSRSGGDIAQRLEFADRLDPTLEGAAVFDVEGALVGMAVPGPRRRTLGIPHLTIARVLEAVAEHGYLPRPFLGLRLQAVWLDAPAQARLGHSQARMALVAGVEPDSPAAEAGVELGDFLLAFAGEPVADAAALAGRLARARPGECLALEVWRGGQTRALTLRVGERRAR